MRLLTAGRFLLMAEWAVCLLVLLSVIWKGGKSLEATWLLAGVSGGITLLAWAERKQAAVSPPPVLFWSGLLFLLLTAFSYVFSKTQNYGLDEVLRDASLFLLFLWAARRIREDTATVPFLERCLLTLSVATILASLAGVAVYVLQPVDRFVGMFFDHRFHTDYWPNAWAEFLLLSWPVVLWTLRKRQSWERVAVLGLVFGVLFLSYSRGGFLAFTAQAAVGGLLLLTVPAAARVSKASLFRAGAEAAGVAVAAIILFLGVNLLRAPFYPVQSVSEKVTFSAAEGISSISERSDFFSASWTLSMSRPWIGLGPGSFRFLQPRFQTEVFSTSDHPHNVFLKLGMERGWPAAVLFGVFIIAVVVLALRGLRESRRDKPTAVPHLCLFLLLLSLTGVLLHNLIDYNLQFVGIAAPLWIIFGVIAADGSSSMVNRSPIPINRYMGMERILAVCVLLLSLYEGSTLALSSFGRHAEAREDPEAALAWYDRSRGELFSRDMHLSRAVLFMDAGRLSEADAALTDYERANREDARAWRLRGDLARIRGDHPVALAAYEEAFVRGKYNYAGITGSLLLTLLDLGDSEGLRSRRNMFDDVATKFHTAISQNTHFIALSPGVEEFADVTEKLERAFTADAARYRLLREEAVAHAEEERERLRGRRNGYLW